jgi:hypothetical protein
VSCSDDTTCAAGNYCLSPNCVAQLANGDSCGSANECLSGNCMDGVCCDAACDGACEACTAAKTGGSDGLCAFIPDGDDPDTECAIGRSCSGNGACVLECGVNQCVDASDCSAGATGDSCLVDPAGCSALACLDYKPANSTEVGIVQSENLSNWDEGDEDGGRGSNRWYCNATLPATNDGLITEWQVWVESDSDSGDQTQLAVIRCGAGSGGTGPVLSDCTRVGLGPVVSIGSSNGLYTFSLAGSQQLDGASANSAGIVVQAGDYICADMDDFDIGVDCNNSTANGGCPGPDFNTQRLVDLDTVSEPFGLNDPGEDGTLMIRAYDTSGEIFGTCSDTEPAVDTTLCSENNGDTCCSGTCVSGPSGPGSCI